MSIAEDTSNINKMYVINSKLYYKYNVYVLHYSM